MQSIAELWLPITLATVACFILSSLAWTVLPHHHKDFREVPDADPLAPKVNAMSLDPGVYIFPMCEDRKKMNSPEFRETYNKGPWGVLHVWHAKPAMGKNMLLTLLFFLIVSALIAYVGYESLGPGAGASRVFQITAVVALLAYSAGGLLNTIWFRVPVRNILSNLADAVAYALATGAVFAWLWPTVTTPVTG